LKWVDIILIIMIVFGAIGGYREGFLMTIISLAAIILGILGGFKLLGNAMLMLDSHFNINESILPFVAFAVVFIIIVIVVSLMGKIIKSSIDHSFLGPVDQAAGALLGIVKSAFLISTLIWIIDAMGLFNIKYLAGESKLFTLVAGFAPFVANWIGHLIPAFKGIF
jgi:membrane protein required for colicin V production